MFINILFTSLNNMNVNILKFKKMIKKNFYKNKNLLFIKCEYNKLWKLFSKYNL